MSKLSSMYRLRTTNCACPICPMATNGCRGSYVPPRPATGREFTENVYQADSGFVGFGTSTLNCSHSGLLLVVMNGYPEFKRRFWRSRSRARSDALFRAAQITSSVVGSSLRLVSGLSATRIFRRSLSVPYSWSTRPYLRLRRLPPHPALQYPFDIAISASRSHSDLWRDDVEQVGVRSAPLVTHLSRRL